MKCFECGEEILKGDVRFIPLDKPYVNLPFHRSTCLIDVIAEGEEKYLKDNLEEIYDYIANKGSEKIKRKKRKVT